MPLLHLPSRVSWALAACAASVFMATGACSSSSTHGLDGGPTDAGQSEAADDAPPDADVRDAADAGALLDANTDALLEASAPPKCAPMNVSAFQPAPFVPTPAPSTSCSAFSGDGGLVGSYGDACLGREATYAACAAVAAPDAAAACYACLVTPESPDASSYGVVIVPTIPVVNYAGCIQAVDPTDAGLSCANAIVGAALCAEYACKSSCPVTDEASREAFTNCTTAAADGACIGYTLAAAECIVAEQGDGGTPVATTCFGGVTEEDHYLSMAHYFCGAN